MREQGALRPQGMAAPQRGRLLPSGDGCWASAVWPGHTACTELCLSFSRWLTQKGARQKKINEWLGIKNETEE